VGILRDRQDGTIVSLRRLSIGATTVAMLLAIGMFVSQSVDGKMPGRCGNLFEVMVHPVRRGSGEKKPERGGDAQAHATLEFRE
jgi:hypothetical protein